MSYTWDIEIINNPTTEVDANNLIEKKDLLNLRNTILLLNFKERCTANFYTVLTVWNSTMKNNENVTVKDSNFNLDKNARFTNECYYNHVNEWMTGI